MQALRKLALTIALLACAGHAKRVQASQNVAVHPARKLASRWLARGRERDGPAIGSAEGLARGPQTKTADGKRLFTLEGARGGSAARSNAGIARRPLPVMADRKPIIGGNWKSNPESVSAVNDLVGKFKEAKFDKDKVDVVLCPTTVHGAAALSGLGECGIEVGIQSISRTGPGAYTGEVTAEMAKEMGYTWALIGHSERRSLFGESIEDTNVKLVEAQNAGLKVMFCIGESLDEREKGLTDDVNKAQLEGALPLVTDWDKFVIAYEPVWAIGTGKVATPEQAQETQASIRAFIKEEMGEEIAERVRIQYGGSANPGNIEGLAGKEDIDGFLVGGASLKPDFTDMIEHLDGQAKAKATEEKQRSTTAEDLGIPCIGECELPSYPNLPPSVHPGVLTGQSMMDLLDHAKANGYALPAVNVVSSSSVNACLEAARKADGPIMIQFSSGGSQFYAGKGLDNTDMRAAIAGGVSGAYHVRAMAEQYGVPVILHTDHCAKKLLPWVDGLLDASERYYEIHGEPLFSSHMLDLSEEPLEENIEICVKYMERMAKIDMLLEIELGITGGEEDGVDNEDAAPEDLYTKPEEVWAMQKALMAVPNARFTIAAAFGNVHGVYAPGNVRLDPKILGNSQKFISAELGLPEGSKPASFVFHGGSGSDIKDIQEAISYGVVKMNVDTDTQWAYWDGLRGYEAKNRGYLQTQIGNPEGEDKPNKKYYDPRMPLRAAEDMQVQRLQQCFEDLNCVGILGLGDMADPQNVMTSFVYDRKAGRSPSGGRRGALPV